MRKIEMNINFKKPIDYLIFQLSQQFRDLSKNELKMLALIHIKGITPEVKSTILNHSIFKSRQSIENHLSKFRKLGIIKDNSLNLDYPISIEKETELNIKIKLG